MHCGSSTDAGSAMILAVVVDDVRSALHTLLPYKGTDFFSSEAPLLLWKIRSRYIVCLANGRIPVLFVNLQIAAYLHPQDLLAFARTSKWLRSILFSRRHRDVWDSSLSLLPALPPCPTDMSAPAYAALLFEKHCSVCYRLL